jgi:hypothetical protein
VKIVSAFLPGGFLVSPLVRRTRGRNFLQPLLLFEVKPGAGPVKPGLRLRDVRRMLEHVRRDARLQLAWPRIAYRKRLATSIVDMSRNERGRVHDFEKFRPDAVLHAKRDNVPIRVRGAVLLNVSAEYGFAHAPRFSALIRKRPGADFNPMIQPTAAGATALSFGVDVFDFHNSCFLFCFQWLQRPVFAG